MIRGRPRRGGSFRRCLSLDTCTTWEMDGWTLHSPRPRAAFECAFAWRCGQCNHGVPTLSASATGVPGYSWVLPHLWCLQSNGR